MLQNDFHLDQNYPNPISISDKGNALTTISFYIPTEQQVTLKVYDLLGGEVAMLLDEQKSSGQHELQFNVSQLPNGLYFYKLSIENLCSAKKRRRK